MTIAPLQAADLPGCLLIYNHYVEKTTASLEEKPLSLEAFTARADELSGRYPFLVAREGDRVEGFCYLSPFNPRSAYRAAADLTLYLSPEARGKGLGAALLEAIEQEGRERGLRDLVSLITDENAASRRFHEKHGFALCGELPAIARKFGRDVGLVYYRKHIKKDCF